MNYIILDLEWDSTYYVKEHRFFNQIIQIGAVKLNSELSIIDTFQVTVKSSISKKLSKRFTQLTGITKEMMEQGETLCNAVKMYNSWAGEDAVTLTWSTSDIYAIHENVKCILENRVAFNFYKYADLQSYVQNYLKKQGEELTGQISLSHAAELLNISFEGLELHTAKDDCILAAALLKTTFNEKEFTPYIRDASGAEFYRRLTYKAHHLTSIHDDSIKKEHLVFSCDACGKEAKRLSSWKYKNRWFLANFYCKSCKRKFVGRVSFKKTYDDIQVKKRVTEYKKAGQSNATTVQQLPEKM